MHSRRMIPMLLLGMGLGSALSSPVQAQSCNATATGLDFGAFSPIRQNALDASGTVRIDCTWPAATTKPNARICLNVGSGSASQSTAPRHLANGANRIRFNLYQDAARSRVWGSVYSGTTPEPITLVLAKPSGSRQASATVSYYGRIEANQPEVPVAGSAATTYTNAFAGTHTALNTHFFLLSDRNCGSVQHTDGLFPFTASARVVNDCTISATNMNFPTTGLLDEPLQARSSLTVRCTNGNAWRLSLSGGGSADVQARRMQGGDGTGSVSYQLYTDSARSTIWGDGRAGTAMVTGTGSGKAQSVSVYGEVPAQDTPAPGAYQDTIIATIMF